MTPHGMCLQFSTCHDMKCACDAVCSCAADPALFFHHLFTVFGRECAVLALVLRDHLLSPCVCYAGICAVQSRACG
eukprot:3894571-Rhodomonas_salina.2